MGTTKATFQEVHDAFRAFSSIGQSKLPAKSAYRISRMLAKLKTEVNRFESVQKKILLDHGAKTDEMGNIKLDAPIDPGKDAAPEAKEKFANDMKAHIAVVQEVQSEMQKFMEEIVEINYDPIPLSMLMHPDPNKSPEIAPNDMFLAGPFIADDTEEAEKKPEQK